MLLSLLPFAGLLMTPSAMAGEPLFSDLVVEMAPTGEVLGSGLDRYDLVVILLAPDGTPISGLEAKAKAVTGETGDVTEIGPGFYRIPWTPERVESETVVDLRFRGKLDKLKVDKTWSMPVKPPYGHQVSVRVDPTQLVLGQDSQASVSVDLVGGAEGVRTGADLLFTVNSGQLGVPAPLGGGSYAALYTPPAAKAPHLALIGVADRREPARTYGHLAIPLAVKSAVPVKVGKGCKVMLTVAGREYGPETADAKGKATVAVVVPPGVTEAKQTVLECASAGESTLALPSNETTRLQFLPVHGGMPADDRLEVPVRVFVVTEKGEPDGSANLVLEPSHGTIQGLRHEGGGVYAATYSPPRLPAVTTATLKASLGGESSAKDISSVSFQLVPVRPGALQVSTVPAELGKDDTSVDVTMMVSGPDGAPLPGRELALNLAGARLASPIRDNKDGTYSATLTTTGRGPVDLIATVKSPAAGNPVRDLVVVPTRTRLPNDGLSSSTLTLLTLDEFGYPVADTELALELRSGDGQLPKTARTDATGIAQVTYTAGRSPALVHIEVQGGGVTRAIGLAQLPMDAPAFDLDPRLLAPTDTRGAALDAWSPIVTRVVIPRNR